MKKIINILVAALSVCALLSSCGKESQAPSSLVGKTYASTVSFDYDGETSGLFCFVFLTEDKVETRLLRNDGKEERGDVLTYTYDNPNLVMRFDDGYEAHTIKTVVDATGFTISDSDIDIDGGLDGSTGQAYRFELRN